MTRYKNGITTKKSWAIQCSYQQSVLVPTTERKKNGIIIFECFGEKKRESSDIVTCFTSLGSWLYLKWWDWDYLNYCFYLKYFILLLRFRLNCFFLSHLRTMFMKLVMVIDTQHIVWYIFRPLYEYINTETMKSNSSLVAAKTYLSRSNQYLYFPAMQSLKHSLSSEQFVVAKWLSKHLFVLNTLSNSRDLYN